MKDPEFWAPLRRQGLELGDWLIERISRRAGRSLAESEQANVRFALQLALGTINNTIINRPGPIFMEQLMFVEQLTRAFRLVSGYDTVAAKAPPRRGAKLTSTSSRA